MANVKRVSLNLNRDREQEATILDWIESTSYAPSKIKDILYNYIVGNELNNNTLRIAPKSNSKKHNDTLSNDKQQIVSDCSNKLQSDTLNNETKSNDTLRSVTISDNELQNKPKVFEVKAKKKDENKSSKSKKLNSIKAFMG